VISQACRSHSLRLALFCSSILRARWISFASAYQRQLIADFAGSAQVTPVACPGLADAIDAGDEAATRAAVATAAARTPANCGAVVLGCTEYELAAGLIGAALPGAALFRSAAAVAAQALRRAGADGADAGPREAPPRAGTVRVLLSGRQAGFPDAALRYPEGRLLAGLAAGRRSPDEPAAGVGSAGDGGAAPLAADRAFADRAGADGAQPGPSHSLPA
jgi:hypothetical protein